MKPRRKRRFFASTPAFANNNVNLRHVAINKQPIAPRLLLLTRERLRPRSGGSLNPCVSDVRPGQRSWAKPIEKTPSQRRIAPSKWVR